MTPLLLISIDGLRPDDLASAEALARLPQLARLAHEGVRARLSTVDPSLTFPAHTTLLTGVAPARHGILQNKPFDPLGRNADGWYWFAEDIRVPTLWDAARARGLRTSNVDWPVSVGADISYNIAQYGRPAHDGSLASAKLLRALSTKGLLQEAERELGVYPPSDACAIEDDARRAAFAVRQIERKRPALHASYFCSLDEIRHAGDPGRLEIAAVLQRLDALVGALREAEERAFGRPVHVAVVSDHGFTRTSRELDLNAALAKAKLLQLDADGRTRGWRAVTWGHGGSAMLVLREPEDHEARRIARLLLLQLSSGPGSPVESFAEITSLRSGAPEAAFRVFLRADTRLVDRREGVVVNARAEVLGDHGHHPMHPEMDAALLLAGPEVLPVRDLGRIDMRSVAPTLAFLLGLELRQAEARSALDPAPLADAGRLRRY